MYSSNFVKMSHINYWNQVNPWKNFWKFPNGPLCRNKSAPFPLLDVAAYRQSSKTEACAKKLFQIHPNNIDSGGTGTGFRIYVRYCLKKLMKNKRGFGKTWHFFSLNSLSLTFRICQMVLWLLGLLLDHFVPQKSTEVSKLWGDIMDFYH